MALAQLWVWWRCLTTYTKGRGKAGPNRDDTSQSGFPSATSLAASERLLAEFLRFPRGDLCTPSCDETEGSHHGE